MSAIDETEDRSSDAARERIVDVGDLQFRVRSSGHHAAFDGPSYVLVHGIGMSHRSQARLHDLLDEEHEVFSVDLPGFAGLRRPDREVPVEVMAEGLGKALDEVDLRDAVVVGHSMGAQWVVELAVQRPDLVAGAAVIGPVVDDRHRHLLAQASALALDTVLETPRANAIVVSDYLRAGSVWYLRQARHMVGYPIDERAAELVMPLLVLRGGRDPIARIEWCRRLRDRAPRGSLVVVPAGAHNVQLTAAPAVASAIKAFTRTLPAPA